MNPRQTVIVDEDGNLFGMIDGRISPLKFSEATAENLFVFWSDSLDCLKEFLDNPWYKKTGNDGYSPNIDKCTFLDVHFGEDGNSFWIGDDKED